MRDRAIQAGAFGGGREGVMAAEFDARNQMQEQDYKHNYYNKDFNKHKQRLQQI